MTPTEYIDTQAALLRAAAIIQKLDLNGFIDVVRRTQNTMYIDKTVFKRGLDITDKLRMLAITAVPMKEIHASYHQAFCQLPNDIVEASGVGECAPSPTP